MSFRRHFFTISALAVAFGLCLVELTRERRMTSFGGESVPAKETLGADADIGAPVHVEGTTSKSFSAHFEPDANRAQLFNFLFSAEFPRWLATEPRALAVVGRRLKVAYPKSGGDEHDPAVSNELMARVGIFRALEGQEAPGLRELYLGTLHAPAEHWLVKRQALINLTRSKQSFGSDEERSETLAKLDPRSVATANLTDTELIEGVIDAP